LHPSALPRKTRISCAGGGDAVARNGRHAGAGNTTRDPHLRRLRNVVEEIAIASCVPVPEIYVLEQEAGINAFAAGYTPNDAAVAVTRGALDRLNRDELQGVIAHEFSHILNGDMRLNIRLMGVLFGILVLGCRAQGAGAHARGGRKRKGAARSC
jgi:Zn-dependent protease with chaperone function